LKDRGPTGSGKSGVVVADQVDGADAVPVGGADEDGTLFDPLSPDVLEHKVDRGPEEDPWRFTTWTFSRRRAASTQGKIRC